jgi:putative ABC transport system permease protein
MTFLDLLRTAFSNLRRRKLRSSLTVLAVVIGAGLVSLLVSLGMGMEGFLTDQVRSVLPSDVVMVASNPDLFQLGLGGLGIGGKPQQIVGNQSGGFNLEPLTAQQIQEIQTLKHVQRIDPFIILQADSVRLKDSQARFRTDVRPQPGYEMEMTQLVAGRYITDQTQGECIIANQYLDVFGFNSPNKALGQEVIIRVTQAASLIGLPAQTNEYSFTIVGVTEKTLSSTEITVSLKDGEVMSRFWAKTPDLYTDKIPPAILQVRVDGSQYTDQVAGEIKNLGLGTMTATDVLGLIGTIFGIVQAVLSAFGLIALAVASLSIVNTLIMSVYERTREIGVMKAVGASKGTIGVLFTAEGAAIGLLGGAIGVAIAYLLGFAIDRIARATFLKDFQTFQVSVFPWWLIVGVIALTTAIATLAALYPARRAARLDPIQSLRYE